MTDSLGPCPQRNERDQLVWDMRDVSRDTGEPRRQFKERVVPAAYADWQRRRAEQAEALLRKGIRWRDHDPKCSDHPGNRCLCGLSDHQARVAAHFDEVKP